MQLLFQDKTLGRAEKIQLISAYILQLIITVTIFISLYRNNWFTAFLTSGILLLTFLPAMIHRNTRVYLPIEFHFITIVFIFVSLFLGEIHSYYTYYWWWDIILHIASGILLGVAGFVLVYTLNRESVHVKMNLAFVALFAFAFAVSIGSLWEIFEFAMDSFFGLNMQKSGLVDTMWDLIVDVLGALFISMLGHWYIKDRESFLFERLVHRFVRKNPRLFQR